MNIQNHINQQNFGQRVPTRNIAANMLDIFTIHGNRWGSQHSKEKTCMQLTGYKLTGDVNNDLYSKYMATMGVSNGIRNKYPELAEKFAEKKAELVQKYGENVFCWPAKEMKKELNKFVKELGMGEHLDINIKEADQYVRRTY